MEWMRQQVAASLSIKSSSALISLFCGGAASPATRRNALLDVIADAPVRAGSRSGARFGNSGSSQQCRCTAERAPRLLQRDLGRCQACCLRAVVTHGAVIRSAFGSDRVRRCIAPTASSGGEAKRRHLLRSARARGRSSMRIDTASQTGTAEPQVPPVTSG